MATTLQMTTDSGNEFLNRLDEIAQGDAAGLKKAAESYGNSWKQRGGVGAFMMLARKWDRFENRLKRGDKVIKLPKLSTEGSSVPKYEDVEIPIVPYDIFAHVAIDQRSEGLIDDIRDLRRYLMLVEAELLARGYKGVHRDNAPDPEAKKA